MFRTEVGAPLGKQGHPAIQEQEATAPPTTYLQVRIQRDCPEQLDAVMAGTKSYAQVAREQGWAIRSKRVSLNGEAEIDAKRLQTAFGPENLSDCRQKLLAAVQLWAMESGSPDLPRPFLGYGQTARLSPSALRLIPRCQGAAPLRLAGQRNAYRRLPQSGQGQQGSRAEGY